MPSTVTAARDYIAPEGSALTNPPHPKDNGTWNLHRIMTGGLAFYALANVVFLVFLCVDHVSFPLTLNALELVVLQHLERAMHGLPIYVDPSPDFVPLVYNPLYYYFALPFAWVLGGNLFTLRLVAILGMCGAGLIIFAAVRAATDSKWWGLIALGLYAAAYRVMDTNLDNANYDSWLLCTILLGCLLIEQSASQLRHIAGIFSIVIAFWFKQPGALFVIGAVVYVWLCAGWRKAWACWLVAIVLGPGLYSVAGPWLFGQRFHYFTSAVPRQWMEFDSLALLRLMRFIARYYFPLAAVAVITSALAILRSPRSCSVWQFLLPVALLTGVVGVADGGSNNNVLIPMGVWFIVAGVLGLKQLLDHLPAWEPWGVHFAVICASFALLLYNPSSVIVASRANASYKDFVGYLRSLDGPVYAPWIGQLQDGYRLYPTAHWVPLEDMIRGPNRSVRDHPLARTVLQPVLHPHATAYVLMNYPLEEDSLMAFLAERYVLDTDLGTRFKALTTLPKRYFFGWPRYLYRYVPEAAHAGAVSQAR